MQIKAKAGNRGNPNTQSKQQDKKTNQKQRKKIEDKKNQQK